jgi:LPXTG-motif cell wall-anchored protein
VTGVQIMDFATYWLVIPLAGLVVIVLAGWLLWSRRRKRRRLSR